MAVFPKLLYPSDLGFPNRTGRKYRLDFSSHHLNFLECLCEEDWRLMRDYLVAQASQIIVNFFFQCCPAIILAVTNGPLKIPFLSTLRNVPGVLAVLTWMRPTLGVSISWLHRTTHKRRF